MEKPKIQEVIAVEGRYDKNTLLQVVDASVLELGGFGIFNDRIVGMSLAVKPFEAWYIPFKEENTAEYTEIVRPLFENGEIAKIGQNIKFDLMVLRRLGLDIRGRKYDTMILHYLLDPESRHNMKYWSLGDYMGFGPGAHSSVGNLRYSYVRDLDKYISAVVGDSMIIDEYEKIVPIQKATEYLMLGMRLTHGISEKEYHRIYRSDWAPIEETFELFERKGWALMTGERWHLTPAGFLISNILINAVLEAQTGAKVENNPWMRDAIRQEKKQELPRGEYERFTSVYRDKMN